MSAPATQVRAGARLGKGVHHWKVQRITSIALIPLSIWFLVSVIALPSHDYTTVVTWVSQKWTTALLMIFIATSAWHSHLGTQVVLEDYARGKTRAFWIAVSRFAHMFFAFLSMFAVFHVAFGGHS